MAKKVNLTPWKEKKSSTGEDVSDTYKRETPSPNLTPWKDNLPKDRNVPSNTIPDAWGDDKAKKDIMDEVADIAPSDSQEAKKPGLLGQFWDSFMVRTQKSAEPVIKGIGVGIDQMEDLFTRDEYKVEKEFLKNNFGIKKDKDLGDVVQKKLREAGENVGKKVDKSIQENEDYTYLQEQAKKWSPEWWARTGGSVASSMAVFLGSTTVGGMLGGAPGAFTTAAGTSYALEGGYAYEEARKSGANSEEADAVAQKVGSINAALEFIPVANFLNDIPGGNTIKRSFVKNTRRALTNLVKKGGKQALSEMTQETAQELVSNSFLKTYDEERELFDNLDTAAVAGLMGGGGVGTINAVVGDLIMPNKLVKQVSDIEEQYYNGEGKQKNVEKNIGNIKTDYEMDITDNASIDESQSRFMKYRNKIEDTFDKEAKYKRADAPDSGMRVKNIFSRQQSMQDRANKFLKDLNNNYGKADYTDLAFKSQEPSQATGETKQAAQEISRWFEGKRDELKERNWLERGFFENKEERLQNEVDNLQEQIEEGRTGARSKEEAQKLLSVLQKNKKKVEEGDLKYVHAPIRLWVEDMMRKNPEQIEQFFSSNILEQRENLRLEDVVEAMEEKGLMSREDVDIRDIIQSYSRQYSRIIAQDEVLSQFQEDGIVKEKSELNETQQKKWTKIPKKYGPYAGKYVKPRFWNNFQAEMGYNQNVGKWEARWHHVAGATKMMAFYNPLFLPMYDVLQGIRATTLIRPFTTSKAIVKAVKTIKNKTDEYYKAKDLGLASQPFTQSFNQFFRDVVKLKNVQDTNLPPGVAHAMAKLKEVGTAAKQAYQGDQSTIVGLFKGSIGGTKEAIKQAYSTSWNTAWQGDRFVRYISYFALKEQGYTSKEAAQRAAEIHGDYASVPRGTRRMMNNVLFTPTFKIAMGKLQVEEGKAFGRWIMGRAKKGDVNKALAFAMMGAMWAGRDYLMRKVLGMKRDQIFRRYYKTVETEEGKKEFAITMSSPETLFWRYFYRYTKKPSDEDVIFSALSKGKWELTPIVRVLTEIATNQGSDYQPIVNNNDGFVRKNLKRAKYGFKEIVRATELIYTDDSKDAKRARKIADKEFGDVTNTVLNLFTFRYVRETKDRANAYKMYKVQQGFKDDLRNLQEKELSKQEREKKAKRLKENALERIEKIREQDINTSISKEKEDALQDFVEKQEKDYAKNNLRPWKNEEGQEINPEEYMPEIKTNK